MEEKISVVVPVYNVEKYLDRCMNSILNKTYENLEIIMVDDGTKDNCDKMCDEYKNKDPRVKVLHKKNGGLGFARNSGIDLSTGKYILFIDSDDYIESNMVQKLYESIKKYDADICYSDFNRVKMGKIISNKHLEKIAGFYKDSQIKEIIVPNLIGGSPDDLEDDVIGWGVWKCIYKTSYLKDVKFHSEKEMISEDIIFQLDYLKKVNKAVIIDDCLYNYCINGSSLSTSYRADRFEKTVFLYQEQLKRLEELGCLDNSKIRADRMLISSIRMELMIAVKQLSYKQALNEIEKIVNDETIIKVINKYPINDLPVKQRKFAQLLKRKSKKLLYFTIFLYVKIKY